MMNFLKIQPSTSLGVKILTKTKKKNNIFGLDFVPIIDGDFLPEPIDELRKKSLGRVCIAGVTEYEALLFASMGKKQYDYESIKRMVNSSIQPERFSNYEELRNEAMKLYVKEGQSKDDLMKSYIRLFSDIFINNGVHQFCDRMVQAGHIVYLYNFQYCPQTIGLLGWWFPFLGTFVVAIVDFFSAATHCTELPYLFGKGIVHTFHPNENDLRMLDRFTTLFTNFAKFG
ncbi:unnamed protein product [Anisakis simplex]|uniref:COesterase domain-containing protein n=1 Tax=Anisakis simplex TaxID=6269 RepID=A0A0M3J8B1_ANISI|nr:unnamed protein product [Anisakis simplex]